VVAEKASSSSSHGDGLEGQIDCGQPKHTDLYNTTMEEIVNHVRIEFKDGELVARTIATGVKLELPKPEKPADADETDIKIWRAEIKDFVREKKSYQQSLERTYGIVWKQCTQNMRANLKALPTFQKMEAASDLIKQAQDFLSYFFCFFAFLLFLLFFVFFCSVHHNNPTPLQCRRRAVVLATSTIAYPLHPYHCPSNIVPVPVVVITIHLVMIIQCQHHTSMSPTHTVSH
jgi:hypothetical protein